MVWIEIFIVVILIMLNYNPGKYLTTAMLTPFQELCCCCCSGLIYFVVFQKTFLYVYFWPRIASFFNQVTCTFLHYQNTYQSRFHRCNWNSFCQSLVFLFECSQMVAMNNKLLNSHLYVVSISISFTCFYFWLNFFHHILWFKLFQN